MSFLAGTLVMHYPDDEEHAFWLFVTLMHKYKWDHLFDPQTDLPPDPSPSPSPSQSFCRSPSNGFSPSLSHCPSCGTCASDTDDSNPDPDPPLLPGQRLGLNSLLDSLARCLSPAVAQHLHAHSLSPAVFASSWLLTLFTATFECWSAVMLIWDLTWVLGPAALVPLRVACACLAHFSSRIVACTDGIALMLMLQRTIPAVVHAVPLRTTILSPEWLLGPLPAPPPFLRMLEPQDRAPRVAAEAGVLGDVT